MSKKSATPQARNPLDDSAPITPISGRLKELRGAESTDHQNKAFAEFISKETTPKENELFEKGFTNSVELLAKEKQLQKPIFKSLRPSLTKRVQWLHKQITPASRLAAIERHRELMKAASELLRQEGYPENISAFIRKLKGILGWTGKKESELSDRALRDFLRKQFGITGKRGRKPR